MPSSVLKTTSPSHNAAASPRWTRGTSQEGRGSGGTTKPRACSTLYPQIAKCPLSVGVIFAFIVLFTSTLLLPTVVLSVHSNLGYCKLCTTKTDMPTPPPSFKRAPELRPTEHPHQCHYERLSVEEMNRPLAEGVRLADEVARMFRGMHGVSASDTATHMRLSRG